MRRFGIMSIAATAAMLVVGQAYAATVLVVAGGGGGSGDSAGANGTVTSAGTAGSGDGGEAGGTAGMGGKGGGSGGGGGGAGLLSAGTDGMDEFPGGGGQSSPGYAGGGRSSFGGGSGGFGGGGGGSSGAGGGGGYSGGGGGGGGGIGRGDAYGGGGGGGSYLDASLTAVAGLPGIDPGGTSSTGINGFITISFLSGTGAAPLAQTFGYTGTIQSYRFAASGLYSIFAAGAQGGRGFVLGGSGAQIGGSGYFTANSTLDLLVGGGGTDGFDGTDEVSSGGGGGGSFVFQTYAAPDMSAVPEPASWAMMITGFGAIGAAMRRRKSTITTQVLYAA